MKEFRGKVAVVTGAASGIGFGLAERCAREGMKVVLAGINEDTLQQAETKLKNAGAVTLAVKTDVAKVVDVQALANKALDTFGAVHLLFNNAGVSVFSTAWESTLKDWEWVLGVNLWGVIHGVHCFMPILQAQGVACHIVNTASTLGLVTPPMNTPYAVSKHAVVALSEALYRELEQRGSQVRVSVLVPGFVRTRVLDSERNRPAALKNESEEGIDLSNEDYRSTMQRYEEGIEAGLSPREVAEKVFAGLKHNTFYIYAGNEGLLPFVKTRMEDILQQRNPSPFS